jgi:hypothetical protein
MAIVVPIVADTKGFEKGLKNVERGSGMLGKAMKTGLLAAGVGLGILVVGLEKSAKEAMNAQVNTAKLDAQLKLMGQNTSVVKGQIDDSLGSLSRMSGFTVDELTGSMASLVRQTRDVKTAQSELAIAMDVARAKGIDLAAATTMVNKAAGGSTKALKELNIHVAKGADGMLILAKIHGRYAGQAAAFGDTAAGGMAKFHAATEELMVSIGNNLIPAIGGAASAVAGFIADVAAQPTMKLKLEFVWDKFKSMMQGLWDMAVAWWNGGGSKRELPARIVLEKTNGEKVKEWWSGLDQTFNDMGKTAGKWLIDGIFSIFTGAGKGSGGSTFGSVMQYFVDNQSGGMLMPGKTLAQNLISGLFSGMWTALKAHIKDFFAPIIDAIQRAQESGLIMSVARGLGGKIAHGVWDGIKALGPWLATKITGWARDALSGLGSLAGKALDAITNGPGSSSGGASGKPKVKSAARTPLAVMQDVWSGRQAAQGYGSTLSSMGGQRIAANAAGIVSTATGTAGMTLQQIRDQQGATQRDRDKQSLNDAITAAGDDADAKKQAEQDLSDWQINENARLLEVQAGQQTDANQKTLDGYIETFRKGGVSAATFNKELTDLLGPSGATLGDQFGTGFADSWQSTYDLLVAQMTEHSSFTTVGDQPASDQVVSPKALRQQRHDDAQRAAYDKINSNDKLTDEEKKAARVKWNTKHPVTTFAVGGIVSSAMQAIIGEHGAEAVLPLSSPKAMRMVADAINAQSSASSQGATYHLTINAGMGTNGASVGRDIVEAIKVFERRNGAVFQAA